MVVNPITTNPLLQQTHTHTVIHPCVCLYVNIHIPTYPHNHIFTYYTNEQEKKAYPIGRLSRSPCNTAGHLSPPPPHTPMGRLSPSYHVHVEGRPASLATATHPYSYSYQQTLHMCAHLTTSQGTGAGRRRVKKVCLHCYTCTGPMSGQH